MIISQSDSLTVGKGRRWCWHLRDFLRVLCIELMVWEWSPDQCWYCKVSAGRYLPIFYFPFEIYMFFVIARCCSFSAMPQQPVLVGFPQYLAMAWTTCIALILLPTHPPRWHLDFETGCVRTRISDWTSVRWEFISFCQDWIYLLDCLCLMLPSPCLTINAPWLERHSIGSVLHLKACWKVVSLKLNWVQ